MVASLKVCRALSQYMFARRNETESSELLVDLSFGFEKINVSLQRGVYENIKKLNESMGFCIEYEKIFASKPAQPQSLVVVQMFQN
jgi:hypothetical protein